MPAFDVPASLPTYADLKNRIVKETNRDDLLDDLADILALHIGDAIDEYAGMRFWFNQVIQPLVTVAGSRTLVMPVSLRIIDRIAGPYTDLSPVTLNEFPDYGEYAAETRGLPSTYAYINGELRFNTIPDQAYNLIAYGVLQADMPSIDIDSNIWTVEAQALIAAHTRMTLYRDQFRDQDGAAMAANAVQMQLDRLRRETQRRTNTRPVARLVGPNGQSVRRAYLDRL